MNHLNKTESFKPQENLNNVTPPSKQLIDLFKQDFKQARESTESSNDGEKSKKNTGETAQIKDLKKDINLQLNHQENAFQHFFPEMGISQIQQIEKIIIQVSKNIQDHITNPITEHYTIILNDAKHPFKIDITKHKQETSLKLTCDPALHALLTQYLPDLKTHLRKKSIEIGDILLELDEDNPKKDEDFRTNEKNNI